MADDKKKTLKNDNLENKELNLEDLKEVSGGSLKDVKYTKTTDISQQTKNKV